MTANDKARQIKAAMRQEQAELVLKNASFVNVFTKELMTGDIAITDGVIVGICEDYSGMKELDMQGKVVCPGLIDGHIHLESAAVLPVEFAKAVVPHGTTTVVTDPHEIANVMGTNGIRYMLEASEGLPLDVRFMLPSCVPATAFDESGATLRAENIEPFYQEDRVLGLAELMNYVGCVQQDEDVMQKVTDAVNHGKIVDGHAPFLSGVELNAYVAAGVYSDHECSDLEEAKQKLARGQYIMIREGTAAQNLKALLPLLMSTAADRCMFATDDKHPSDLLTKGHIDYIIREAVRGGVDPITAVCAGTCHAARYFNMKTKGAIAPGYDADLTIVDSLESFQVQTVIQKGRVVFDGQLCEIQTPVIDSELSREALDTFHLDRVSASDFLKEGSLPLIGMIPGEIVSQNCGHADGVDLSKDVLKIAVVERHHHTGHIGVGLITGYGLKEGAVATSVAHDSHNIIVIGTSEEEMAAAVNALIELKGGIVIVKDSERIADLPLPVAGLMSTVSLEDTNRMLNEAKEQAYLLGVQHEIDPFMTLSFMSLPVIPSLRVLTQGVFDVDAWKYLC